jgi:hypothetical protein
MKGGSAATCMGMGTPLPLEQGSPQAQRDVKGPASGTVTTRTTRECSCGPGSSSSGMRMHSSFSRAIAVPCRPVPSTPHPTMWRFRSALLCLCDTTTGGLERQAGTCFQRSKAEMGWSMQCHPCLAPTAVVGRSATLSVRGSCSAAPPN